MAEHATGRPVGRAVVTGSAGFIGSHLVDRLLAEGFGVIGVDNLDPWYAPRRKVANLRASITNPAFEFIADDVNDLDLVGLFGDVDVVFHLAGRPGVQDSWGSGFAASCHLNIDLTQQVLEAAEAAEVGRVVLASSSSIYGDGAGRGDRTVAPISPYGVSKAAAEQLGSVYARRGLDIVTLRYFTVFGPRQRPDMAMHRLFASCLGSLPFRRRGDGSQRREFTFVDDVVGATLAAATAPSRSVAGAALDIGGGCETSLNDVIDAVEVVSGRKPVIEAQPGMHGDPMRTTAAIASTYDAIGWRPETDLLGGLAKQWAWHCAMVGQDDDPGDDASGGTAASRLSFDRVPG